MADVNSKSLSSSVSRTLFRRNHTKGKKTETRARSQSLDLLEAPALSSKTSKNATSHSETVWSEISQIKTQGPVVVCVLPAVATDLVCSALIAIGATPLFVEDREDLESCLQNCKAVVVDVSARKELVEAALESYIPGQVPLILVAYGVGTNDRKKKLARTIVEKCDPTVISGRMGDISALAMDVMDRATGMLDQDEDKQVNQRAPSPSISVRNTSRHQQASPQVIRKKKGQGFQGFQRKGTVIPAVLKKGQFRDNSMKDVSPQVALDMAGKLAAQTGAFVHLYETNTLTSGEQILEINNSQLGMNNLHSIVPCSAAIIAAVLAGVDDQGSIMTLNHCGHALSLYHVAAEKATLLSTDGSTGVIAPGSLRWHLINYLYILDEPTVREQAEIVIHNT